MATGQTASFLVSSTNFSFYMTLISLIEKTLLHQLFFRNNIGRKISAFVAYSFLKSWASNSSPRRSLAFQFFFGIYRFFHSRLEHSKGLLKTRIINFILFYISSSYLNNKPDPVLTQLPIHSARVPTTQGRLRSSGLLMCLIYYVHMRLAVLFPHGFYPSFPPMDAR